MAKNETSFWKMVLGSQKTDTTLIKQQKQTPSYVTVAQDLNSPEQQVFEAAVYYLCVMASQKPEYQKEISDILMSQMKKNQKQASRVAYIKKMMEEYALNGKIHN